MNSTVRAHRSLDRTLVLNAVSLVGSTAVTSGLGFVYWWLAARVFAPTEVGLASAAVSAMLFLGTVGTLGLSTLLVGELPRRRGQVGPLVSAALLTTGFLSTGLGLLFAVVAPHLSQELSPLAQDLGVSLLFAIGVGLTGLTLVLDQALIGVLRGELQLWRNVVASVAKPVALVLVSILAIGPGGMAIYATWATAQVVSLGVLAGLLAFKGFRVASWPQFGLMSGLGRAALKHHALNLIVQGPTLVLPLIVTISLSSAVNASFYLAWLLAGFVFVVPNALTTALYAVAVEEPTALSARLRSTLRLSLLASLLSAVVLIVAAHQVLSIFGEDYVRQAEGSLRVLALASFPMIVKVYYVALARICTRFNEAIIIAALGGLVELACAALGARVGGLIGLSIGLVLSLMLEAIVMGRSVLTAMNLGRGR